MKDRLIVTAIFIGLISIIGPLTTKDKQTAVAKPLTIDREILLNPQLSIDPIQDSYDRCVKANPGNEGIYCPPITSPSTPPPTPSYSTLMIDGKSYFCSHGQNNVTNCI